MTPRTISKRRRAGQRSRAFTLIELLIVMEVVMTLAGMAIPNLRLTQKSANEQSAVGSLRELSDAQELYRPRQNPPMYADSVGTLRTAGLIAEGLGNGTKSGYSFAMVGASTQNTYAFKATATVQAGTGDRSFYVDQTGIIRMANDASVTAFSQPLQ